MVLPAVPRGAQPHVLPLRVCRQEQLLPADQPCLLHQPRPPHLLPLHRPLHRHGESPGMALGLGGQQGDRGTGWSAGQGAARCATAVLGSALLLSLNPFLPSGSVGDGFSRVCCGVMHFKSQERLWGQSRPGFPGVVAGMDGSRSLAVTPGAVGSAAPGTIFSPSSVRFSSCPSSRAAPPVCLGLLKASVAGLAGGLPDPGEGSLACSPTGVRGRLRPRCPALPCPASQDTNKTPDYYSPLGRSRQASALFLAAFASGLLEARDSGKPQHSSV